MPLWSRQALRLRVQDLPWQRLVAALLALAALLAGLSAWMLALDAARTEPVVIAAGPIAPGERIRAEQLTVVQAPRIRPAALQGVAEPELLIGQYARVPMSAQQVLTSALVQAQPLTEHIFPNEPLPAERLTATVYELPRTGLTALTSQDRVHILALVDSTQGSDPNFRIGMIDRPGSGPRVVRVLRNLNVLAVTERTAFLEVSPTQSAYLWALQSASISIVGELSAQADAPLGPLSLAEVSLAALMAEARDTEAAP